MKIYALALALASLDATAASVPSKGTSAPSLEEFRAGGPGCDRGGSAELIGEDLLRLDFSGISVAPDTTRRTFCQYILTLRPPYGHTYAVVGVLGSLSADVQDEAATVKLKSYVQGSTETVALLTKELTQTRASNQRFFEQPAQPTTGPCGATRALNVKAEAFLAGASGSLSLGRNVYLLMEWVPCEKK